ncbi:hypothetical protein [Sediminibacterium sp. KACHI17]
MKALFYCLLLSCLLMGCDKYSETVIEPSTCKFINYCYFGDSTATLGELSNSYILVAFDSNATESQIRSFIRSEKEFDSTFTYTLYGNTAPLKFKQSKDCQDITAFIATLQKDPMVTFVHYTMKTDCSYTFMPILASRCVNTYSNFFTVKIKDANDLTDLHTMIKLTGTKLVEQDRFSPQWFTLKADKNSKGDALHMANHFKESKLFERAEPKLLKIPVE